MTITVTEMDGPPYTFCYTPRGRGVRWRRYRNDSSAATAGPFFTPVLSVINTVIIFPPMISSIIIVIVPMPATLDFMIMMVAMTMPVGTVTMMPVPVGVADLVIAVFIVSSIRMYRATCKKIGNKQNTC